MDEPSKDAEITAAVKNVNQKLLPRRINFVKAKYDYKMEINDSIVYSVNTDYYSICYGNSTKSNSKIRGTIFDPQKLSQIKSWTTRYNSGIGYTDSYRRGFATSILYALRACPCFRQFSRFHKDSCQRLACNLCKIYKFFEETEQNSNEIHFPLELNVFDRKWILGSPGDSAEFFTQLMNVLQNEEVENSHVLQSINPYTSAIGQMFRIESQDKLICKNCGRQRFVKDGYWSYYLSNRIEKSVLSSKPSFLVENCFCDACGSPFYSTEEFISELPFIFTIQLNNWDDKFQYRRKHFQASRYMNLTISNVKYRLCAFTSYDGTTSEGGKFCTAFRTSSGTWNSMVKGKINLINTDALSSFNPQLLFYTRDEPNTTSEKSSASPASYTQAGSLIASKLSSNNAAFAQQTQAEDFSSDSDDQGSGLAQLQLKKETDAFTESIQKQLQRNIPKPPDPNIVVVDTTDSKSRKVDRNKVKNNKGLNQNPMEKLSRLSRNAHNVSTWDGIEVDQTERIENAGGWKEEGPDEWDQNLDKGHVRKIKNKRPPPIENPFDKAAMEKRKPNDFKTKDDKKKKYPKNQHQNKFRKDKKH